MGETQKVEYVEISRISVPRERVTSVWDPALEEEFNESVKSKGILEPVTLMEIHGELWLIDGLHRIQAAEKLGIPSVPAIIRKGELQDLLIENIIRNRQRGKSNPSQEAEVLAFLVEKRGFSVAMASKQLGMSEQWASRLVAISHLPEEVKDLIKHGKVPITGAFYITHIPRPEDQIQVGRDADFYKYTAEQIKARVYQLLNPDVTPEPGEVGFDEKGAPARIPLTCHFCGKVLESSESYVWTCKDCLELARDTIDYYRKTYESKAEAQDLPTLVRRVGSEPATLSPP